MSRGVSNKITYKPYNQNEQWLLPFQIRNLLIKDEGLKESARNNSEQDFANAFNDSTNQALVAGYKQNKDFYKILLNDEKYRKEVMNVFLDEIYQMFNKDDGDDE